MGTLSRSRSGTCSIDSCRRRIVSGTGLTSESDGEYERQASSAFRDRNQPERFRAKACPGLARGWAPVRVRKTRESENLELQFNRNASSGAIVNSFDLAQHCALHATYPGYVARRSEMSIVKRPGTVAVAAVLAIALLAPPGAQARK